jgi:hypothetical protein
MTQPYGGQQQPGGQYPDSGGLPQAPGYSMPQAPQEYSSGPIPRPGVATTAAVLAFVQAGLTTITTLLVWIGVFNLEGSDMAIQLAIALAQTVGIVLLIMGGVQLMGGKNRNLLIAGAAVELAVCVAWLIQFAVVESEGIELLENAKAGGIAIALFFAIMPALIIFLSLNRQTTEFLQSRRRR